VWVSMVPFSVQCVVKVSNLVSLVEIVVAEVETPSPGAVPLVAVRLKMGIGTDEEVELVVDEIARPEVFEIIDAL